MGKEKTVMRSEGFQQAAATPEEQELNRLQLEQARAAQPGALDLARLGPALAGNLLRGEQLPGQLGGLQGGISPEAIGAQATEFATQALPGFQSLGILDSGTALKGLAEGIASQVLFPAEQFNIQTLMQLLNLAGGAPAQALAPTLGTTGQLGQRLAGLRGISTAGTERGTTRTNFFASPFGAGIGQGLGQAGGTALFGG